MNDCVKVRTRSLGMLRVCLGDSSMRLGVPFIAPRQLGAVGGQQGRLSLPSVGWRTGQSGAPPDSHCSMFGADLLPYLAQMTIAAPWQLAHRTLSGAHRTVRCPHPTVGSTTRHARIAWPTVGSADRWLTGQSGAPPNSPVIYSRTPPTKPESSQFARASLAHRTVRCTQTEQCLGCSSQVFSICLFSDSST